MWNLLKTAGNDWLRHSDARLGAALAYYSVFSLGPLLLIVVSIAGLFFGEDAVRTALTAQFHSLLGPLGSQAVETMLKGAGIWWYLRTYLISFAGILGLGFLLAVSLVISTTLSAISSWLGGGAQSLFWKTVNFLV